MRRKKGFTQLYFYLIIFFFFTLTNYFSFTLKEINYFSFGYFLHIKLNFAIYYFFMERLVYQCSF
jgi:hypothetical protein